MWSLNRAEPENLEDTCHLNEKKKIVRVDDKFTHKPTMKIDDAKKAVEVTFPYLETGKDEYVATLGFNSAMTYWAEFTTTMFGKAPELQAGDVHRRAERSAGPEDHDDARAVRREAFDGAGDDRVVLGDHVRQARAAQDRRQGRARRIRKQHKTKTYKAALSFLPKEQVMVSPKLK